MKYELKPEDYCDVVMRGAYSIMDDITSYQEKINKIDPRLGNLMQSAISMAKESMGIAMDLAYSKVDEEKLDAYLMEKHGNTDLPDF